MRTVSPYFSSKMAMAPRRLASSMERISVTTGALPRILLVGHVLDALDLLGGEGPVVGEVEAEHVGADARALLLRVLAEHGAEGPVEDVGGRVVAARGAARGVVDQQRHLVADGEGALADHALVDHQARDRLLRVADLDAQP